MDAYICACKCDSVGLLCTCMRRQFRNGVSSSGTGCACCWYVDRGWFTDSHLNWNDFCDIVYWLHTHTRVQVRTGHQHTHSHTFTHTQVRVEGGLADNVLCTAAFWGWSLVKCLSSSTATTTRILYICLPFACPWLCRRSRSLAQPFLSILRLY